MTPEEIKADKRLQRTYGITLAEYNQKLRDQGNACAICRRPPSSKRLAVDHDHRFDRIKITVRKVNWSTGKAWEASSPETPIPIVNLNRKEAKEQIRRRLRRRSIRGLLCMNCNRGLQKFYDKPERFEAAAQYLRKFNGA